jgi:inorganic pyrophosphatase
MDEQLQLLHQAMRQPASSGAPVDISVSRQCGDCTVTMRAQIGAGPGGAPSASMMPASVPLGAAGALPGEPASIGRAYTRNSFYEDESEVPNLLAEIDRLKRKALSRGVVLTSKDEDVPAEDVVVLRQIFSIADDAGDGKINEEQFGQLHTVLGEPLQGAELHTAFKAIDTSRAGSVTFDDFLAWYTLAHSASGVLSKKGAAYTNRFKKIMTKLAGTFDIKHLTTATTGEPNLLDFRVQFHYNDNGQLKQISPWHDIPLYSPDGCATQKHHAHKQHMALPQKQHAPLPHKLHAYDPAAARAHVHARTRTRTHTGYVQATDRAATRAMRAAACRLRRTPRAVCVCHGRAPCEQLSGLWCPLCSGAHLAQPRCGARSYCHMVTEIPKFSRAKFEIATGEPLNPIKQDTKNGKLREYKYGDMCFNYGAFPQTWEDPSHTTPDTGFVGDNDPIDCMEIGYKMLRTGSVTKVKVLGCLAMIDDGETDWKVVCIAADDPLAPQLNDINDVERVLPGYISVMREWLRMYKTVDGKPMNEFGLEEKAVGKEYTLNVIKETHDFWKKLTASGAKTV